MCPLSQGSYISQEDDFKPQGPSCLSAFLQVSSLGD